jgi:HupE / UreJ protein
MRMAWNNAWRKTQRVALAVAGALLLAPAQAHLMVAQKGTLNFSGDGVYMVLSVPVSAFEGVDDDGDQLLSIAELRAHAAHIERQVQAGAQVLSAGQPQPLQGLMLNLSPPDDRPSAPADQIVVMGRYALAAVGDDAQPQLLSFKLSLFGRVPAEQVFDITITRKPEAQAARFTPSHSVHPVLPTAGRVFADQVRNGIEHVLGGADHLLFLLVVLASLAGARAGWRQAVGTLTCFTAGHALALAASAWGHVSISPALVEPGIAVTIIGMAVFDLWQRHRGRWAAPALQMGLVFACALVHGLGFASALGSLGLSGAPLVWSLAGFNLGIELAQVGVAALTAAGLAVLARSVGRGIAGRTSLAASVLGVALGCWWFVDRASVWL